MKIKNLAIIILMITFFIILGTNVYATTGRINEKEVKLRKEPDSKTIIDYVYKDDEVEILEREDGWYKVKATTELGKVTGYIKQGEVNVGEELTQTVDTTTPEKTDEKEPIEEQSTSNVIEDSTQINPTTPVKINNIEEKKQYALQQEIGIRAIPLINSREKAKITGNITVIEIINDWAKIENDTEMGWVRKNTLKNSITTTEEIVSEQEIQEQPEQIIEEKPTETQPEETKEPEKPQEKEETKLNKVGYVSTEGLRVRKGPSTDTEEITSLSRNDKIEIISQNGKWYKIKIDGEIGYISAKYISDTKLPETTSRGGSTVRTEKAEDIEETKKEEAPKVEETVQQSVPTSGTTGNAVVEYAKQYLGYKYVSGGASPSKGFDCSGFTTYVYKHFGVSLNRTSGAQINNGVAVSKDDLQPGDLVIFNNDANTKIGHVGIYVGGGNFIHASNPQDGVKITTLLSGYYKTRYVGARRVI